MAKAYKSKAMAAIHETMADLHEAGAIDRKTMQKFDAMCLSRSAEPRIVAPKGRAGQKLKFVIFKDTRGEWRWRLNAANRRTIATSGEGYATKADCLAAIRLVRQAADAQIAA